MDSIVGSTIQRWRGKAFVKAKGLESCICFFHILSGER